MGGIGKKQQRFFKSLSSTGRKIKTYSKPVLIGTGCWRKLEAVTFSKLKTFRPAVPGVPGFTEMKKINPKITVQKFIAGVIWVWRPHCSLTTEQANKQEIKSE